MYNVNFKFQFDSSNDEKSMAIVKKFGYSLADISTLDSAISTTCQNYVNVVEQDKNKEAISCGEAVTVETVALIVGIVVGAVAIVKEAYALGQYSARQCEVRLGLTKSIYEGSRNQIRAALIAASLPGGILAATVALGFDDYYSGI